MLFCEFLWISGSCSWSRCKRMNYPFFWVANEWTQKKFDWMKSMFWRHPVLPMLLYVTFLVNAPPISRVTPLLNGPFLTFVTYYARLKWNSLWTRIHWLDQRIVRKQLDIMPTCHYLENQGKLMMQSRENGKNLNLGNFFDDFEVKYFQIGNFSEK